MSITTDGKNKLGAYALFVQRRLYEEFAYPYDQDNVALAFDLWHYKPFYARIDPDGVPIYPMEHKLKRLESSPDKNLFVLDFVADAFEDFRKNYLFLNKEDARGTAFQYMIPHQAYLNPIKAREEYIETIYKLFVGSYLPVEKRYEKVTSFRSFLKLFKKFMKELSSDLPLTLTNYMFSGYVSPLSSGVMIEIAEEAYDQDKPKCVNFFQNVCFPCYTEAAQKFGFKIDKNVPWRLIADLKSPCMGKYMARYHIANQSSNETEPESITFGSMFHYYYNKTYLSDINFIRDSLAQFYYSYVSANPVFTRYFFSPKCGDFKKEVIVRERISKEMIEVHFSDVYWLNYYIQILSYEIKDKKKLGELREIVIMAQTKLKKEGFESATRYIFESFKENMLTIG